MADEPLVVRVAANLDDLRKNLAEGVNQIESTATAMRQMATAYDGSRAIAQAGATMAAIQAVGGATHLTADEQAKANVILDAAIQKYAALGKTAPPGMQALADATRQANEPTSQFGDLLTRITERLTIYEALREGFSFAKEAIESTAKLEEMSTATGITTDAIQRLAYVGAESGIDIDQLTRSVEQLSAKLANGDANATAAVQLLGLSVKDLQAAGPEETFIQIAEAVGKVDDPMTKAAIASDLWGGRLSKQLLPVLGDLRQKMLDVPQGAVISDANIAKAHEFEVGLGHLETTLKSWTVTALGAISRFDEWENGAAYAAQATGTHTEAVAKAAEANLHLIETVKQKIEADRLEAEELKKFTAAMVELDAAGVGWQGTLAGIDGATVEAVKFYLAAGVAQNQLAIAYGLTAAQVKAVATELKDEQEQLKIGIAQQAELTKVTDAYYRTVAASSHDSVQRQIDDAYLAADAQVAAMEKSKTYSVAAELMIWQAAERTADNIVQKSLESDRYTKEHYQLLADQAEIAYDFALAHASSYTSQEIQLFADKYRAAEQASNHWAATASDDMDKAATHGKTAAASLVTAIVDLQSTLSMAEAASSADLNSQIKNVQTLAGLYITAGQAKSAFDSGGSYAVPTTTITDANKASFIARLQSIEREYAMFPGRESGVNGPTGLSANDAAGWSAMLKEQVEFASLKAALPGYAVGVTNAPGGFAMVGERGPEVMYVPPGANIYPNGSGAGGGQTIQIFVTQPLGTPDAIAAAVDAALMARQRNTGQRL